MQTVSPLLGGTYQSRSLLLSAQRAINVYPEMVETKDGKTVGAFYGCPGLLTILEADTPGPWRALHVLGNGAMFGVKGTTFYQITGSYALLNLGTLHTSKGPVGMVNNGLQILLVDGDRAYGYDLGTAVFKPIDLPFVAQAPIVCAYQDGFFLLNQTGTQKWWQSDLNQVMVWNGLNFSSKDGQPDPIVTMLDNHREVWLFGSQTTEIWINAGNPGFAFQRLQGIFIQEGCAAPYSAQVVGESVMWLSRNKEGNGMVMRAQGYTAVKVSTHAIERQIQSYVRIDDAIAYTYQQEGHQFYVITFPQADVTWCYDLTTGLWHERADFYDGLFHRHRSNCCAFFRGQNVVGDFENGKLYAFDLNTYTDDNKKRKWLRSWPAQPTGQMTRRRDTHDLLEIYTEPGGGLECTIPVRVLQSSDDDIRELGKKVINDDVRVLSGIVDDDCEDPLYMLRFSDTGALSWSNERFMSAGKIGEVKRRYFATRLGSSRDRVYELSSSDPFHVRLVGALLTTSPGTS
jgi:hypothetical protein